MGAAIRFFPAAECLLALMAGIAACRFGGLTAFALLALTVAALLLMLVSRMRMAARALLPLFAAGGFALLASADAAFEHPAHIANNVPAKGALRGRVAGGFEYFSETACRFTLEAETLDGQPVEGGVQVSLRAMEGDAPLPGDELLIEKARLKPITGMRNIGGFDYAAYMRDAGIGARLSLRGDAFTVARHAPFWRPDAAGERLRRHIFRFITAHFPKERAAAVAAVSIGITGPLDRQERRNYTVAGIAHLFSVSGLHVGFISGIAFFLLNYLFFHLCWFLNRAWAEAGAHRRAAALAALVAVGLFVVTAGMKVAAVRAGIMAAALFIAIAVRRENHLLNALAVAALATLLYDPAALFNISFILSYGAMAAIVMVLASREGKETDPLAPAAAGFWRRRWDELLLTVTVSGAITLALAPVMMTVFNEMHAAGLFANVAAIPLGAVAVPSVFAAAFIGHFFPFAADAAGVLAALPYAALDAMAAFFAAHPLLSFSGPAPAAWLVALFYGAFLLFFFARRAVAFGAAIICAGAIAAFYWPAPRGHTEFRFIDVGQGDSTLILFKGGAAVLVDGGPAFGNFDAGELAILPELRRLGVRRLDAVIATHGDMDHVGGLFAVLRGFPVRAYYDNGGDEKMLVALRSLARSRGAEGGVLAAGARLPFGESSIEVLHPAPAFFAAVKERKDNNRSLVMMVEAEGRRLLLPGDAEAPAERAMLERETPLRADLLHVAHHGSRSSTTAPFADAVAPRLAVISAGVANIFHFPARATLETLAGRGVTVFRTDLMGEVALRPAPEGFYAKSWVEPDERFIPVP